MSITTPHHEITITEYLPSPKTPPSPHHQYGHPLPLAQPTLTTTLQPFTARTSAGARLKQLRFYLIPLWLFNQKEEEEEEEERKEKKKRATTNGKWVRKTNLLPTSKYTRACKRGHAHHIRANRQARAQRDVRCCCCRGLTSVSQLLILKTMKQHQ